MKRCTGYCGMIERIAATAAAERGIPVKVVAAHFQKDPQILMTHPGQGLDDWEDLKDIELLISETGFHSYYRWLMDEHGFTAEQRAPYTFNSAPFLADARIGQQGYLTSEPFAIEREAGFQPNVFLLADHGFDTYSTTIEAMRGTIEQRPQIVQCFVDASTLGWYHYLYGDPGPGNALIQAANPEITDAQLAYSTEKMKEYGIVDSDAALKLGIGAMRPERFRSFYDKMVSAGVLQGGLDVSKAYTLDFVNQGVGLDLKRKLTGGN